MVYTDISATACSGLNIESTSAPAMNWNSSDCLRRSCLAHRCSAIDPDCKVAARSPGRASRRAVRRGPSAVRLAKRHGMKTQTPPGPANA
jgi:hypothetical protein